MTPSRPTTAPQLPRLDQPTAAAGGGEADADTSGGGGGAGAYGLLTGRRWSNMGLSTWRDVLGPLSLVPGASGSAAVEKTDIHTPPLGTPRLRMPARKAGGSGSDEGKVVKGGVPGSRNKDRVGWASARSEESGLSESEAVM